VFPKNSLSKEDQLIINSEPLNIVNPINDFLSKFFICCNRLKYNEHKINNEIRSETFKNNSPNNQKIPDNFESIYSSVLLHNPFRIEDMQKQIEIIECDMINKKLESITWKDEILCEIIKDKKSDKIDLKKPLTGLDYYEDFKVRKDTIDLNLVEEIYDLSKQKISKNLPSYYQDKKPEHLFEDAVIYSFGYLAIFNNVYQLGYKLTGKKRTDGLVLYKKENKIIGIAIDAKSKKTNGPYKFSDSQINRLNEEINIIKTTTPIKYLFIISTSFDPHDVKNAWNKFLENQIYLICFSSKYLQNIINKKIKNNNGLEPKILEKLLKLSEEKEIILE